MYSGNDTVAPVQNLQTETCCWTLLVTSFERSFCVYYRHVLAMLQNVLESIRPLNTRFLSGRCKPLPVACQICLVNIYISFGIPMADWGQLRYRSQIRSMVNVLILDSPKVSVQRRNPPFFLDLFVPVDFCPSWKGVCVNWVHHMVVS